MKGKQLKDEKGKPCLGYREFVESGVGAGAMLTDHEPGIPGGETPPSTAGGTPAATDARFMVRGDGERRPGAPQSRTRGDVSTAGRTLGVLECGGESAAHGSEDAWSFKGSGVGASAMLTDLETGRIPRGETPLSTAGGTPAATEARFMESPLFEFDLLTDHEPGKIPGGETPPSTAGESPAATDAEVHGEPPVRKRPAHGL